MAPDFEIITPRLALKLIPSEQAHSLQRLLVESPSLHQWLDWCNEDVSLKDAQDFLLATRLNWGKNRGFWLWGL